MDTIIEIAKNYHKEAARLNEYRRKLIQMIKAERDVDRLKDLEQRKSVIEAERYEIIDDLRALNSYIAERRRHEESDIA